MKFWQGQTKSLADGKDSKLANLAGNNYSFGREVREVSEKTGEEKPGPKSFSRDVEANLMTRYLAVTYQADFPLIYHREEIPERVNRLLKVIDDMVMGYRHLLPVKLIAFPEFAICPVSYPTSEELLRNLAIEASDPLFLSFVEKAQEHDIYVEIGTFLEKDARWPQVVFNTSLLVGPEGVLLKYRKVNPLIPLEVCASPVDLPGYDMELFPVAETPVGRIGIAICYDLVMPEVARELVFRGAEVILNPSAWMLPWGSQAPQDSITVVAQARAIENTVYIITSRLSPSYAHHPPYSWSGGSVVIDPEGRLLARTASSHGEATALAIIDLAEVRDRRCRQNLFSPLAHLRTQAYSLYQTEIFPWDEEQEGGEITEERLVSKIEQSKRRLRWII